MIRSFLAPLALAAAVAMATPAAAIVYTGPGAKIPDNSFTLSTITITDDFLIQDLNVSFEKIAHNFSGDVQLFLTKGDLTVTLFNRHGHNNYLQGALTFDDQAATAITSFPTIGAVSYRPFQSLAAFNGLSAAGVWTLKAADVSGGVAGAYDGWSLDITPQAVAAVPEPATWAMMILGFGAAGAVLRRRRDSTLAGAR